MFDIISREVTTSDLKDVVSKLIPDSMSLDIQVNVAQLRHGKNKQRNASEPEEKISF